MKQILWFRRDLRVNDSAILAYAKDEVLPIFIFDKNILDKLKKDDKRVTFIYESVLKLKENLKKLGLNLAIFYSTPKEVFQILKNQGFDNILCSVDFDDYAKKRDEEIAKIIPIQTFTDAFITHPNDCLKADKTPYKVFTPYYKNLEFIWNSYRLEEFETNKNLKLIPFDYEKILTQAYLIPDPETGILKHTFAENIENPEDLAVLTTAEQILPGTYIKKYLYRPICNI